MAETDKNEETEAAPKPKTTAKAKAKPKAKAKAKAKPKVKAKAKAKPKAETASKANTAKVESPQTQAPKQKSFTTVLLLAVIAILVVITTYKLNMEINTLSAHDDVQVNGVDVVTAPVAAPVTAPAVPPIAETQAEPANIKEDTAAVKAPVQVTPPANRTSVEQARAQAVTRMKARSAMHDKTMQQRRQAFEKKMQLKKQE